MGNGALDPVEYEGSFLGVPSGPMPPWSGGSGDGSSAPYPLPAEDSASAGGPGRDSETGPRWGRPSGSHPTPTTSPHPPGGHHPMPGRPGPSRHAVGHHQVLMGVCIAVFFIAKMMARRRARLVARVVEGKLAEFNATDAGHGIQWKLHVNNLALRGGHTVFSMELLLQYLFDESNRPVALGDLGRRPNDKGESSATPLLTV